MSLCRKSLTESTRAPRPLLSMENDNPYMFPCHLSLPLLPTSQRSHKRITHQLFPKLSFAALHLQRLISVSPPLARNLFRDPGRSLSLMPLPLHHSMPFLVMSTPTQIYPPLHLLRNLQHSASLVRATQIHQSPSAYYDPRIQRMP